MKPIGEKMTYLRKRSGLSQGELAFHLNMSRSKVAKLETNTQPPSMEDLMTIGDFFQISLDHLVGRDFSKIQTLSEVKQVYQVGQAVLDTELYEVVTLLSTYPHLQSSLHQVSSLPKTKQDKRIPLITSLMTQIAQLDD
ncbi:helix-turn-helix domain-containing protein [Metabacillus iocasae]|uniref:Transcriptional regulator with XRE-family HTH domain n=1 Tax=Priestia iocasae TaxID=2291674 RepID=A0ABS2QXN2_9BACI|nr:helix-turn-helix transcriptional regulator [Metabacillus iocasae]MBM7704018.1 transcriptional regulator with XRE-family HTH domain [Metabacillus iocasae]